MFATLIFYDSPRRIKTVLEEILEVFGDRPAVIAREITKIHEEFIRGNLSELAAVIERMQPVKGEITLLVSAAKPDNTIDYENLKKQISSELKKGDACASVLAKQLSKSFGIPKNIIYNMILELKSSADE